MKLLYKPFGLLVGVLGGRGVATSFNRLWRLVDNEGQAPKSTDRDSSWRQVVIASAMKGAVFGVVKAATDRAGATWFAYLTGTWPGKESDKRKAT
jgi:Protein of unknown function (DUF4235)